MHVLVEEEEEEEEEVLVVVGEAVHRLMGVVVVAEAHTVTEGTRRTDVAAEVVVVSSEVGLLVVEP